MQAANNNKYEDNMCRWSSYSLRVGIYVTLTLIVTSFILLIIKGNSYTIQTTIPAEQLPKELISFNPVAVATVAILLLLIAPFIPVLTSAVASFLAKDRRLFVVSLTLLCLIALTITIAFVRF